MIPKDKKPGRMKAKRLQSKKHLEFVGGKWCCICGCPPGPPRHLLRADPKRGMGRRASDEYVIPLCPTCHDALHMHGDEVTFLEARNIDGPALARQLAAASPDPKIRMSVKGTDHG